MHSKFMLLSLVVVGLVAIVLGGPLPLQHSLNTQPSGFLAEDRSADSVGWKERRKRCYQDGILHNYIETVLEKSVIGNEWLLDNCESEYNCNNVSRHHCNPNVVKDFDCSDNKVSKTCTIQFHPNKGHYLDVDLALYKAPEQDLFSSYNVYILLLYTPTYVHFVASRTISSACSGWQVFHLSQDPKQTLQTSNGPTSFRIIVRRNGTEKMSCEQISNLFLLSNTSTSQASKEQGEQGEQEEQGEEGSGREDSKLLTEPSSEEDTNPFPISRDQQIHYIPILNMFYVGEGYFEVP